jgi:hypothetical protein
MWKRERERNRERKRPRDREKERERRVKGDRRVKAQKGHLDCSQGGPAHSNCSPTIPSPPLRTCRISIERENEGTLWKRKMSNIEEESECACERREREEREKERERENAKRVVDQMKRIRLLSESAK